MNIRFSEFISSILNRVGLILFLAFFAFSGPISAQDTQGLLNRIYHAELPDDMGTIEQRWHGSEDQMLILVQDSHISLEVQLNIAKIIQFFVNDYGVELVNIEGADHEKIDFQELRELEPKDIVEKVSIDFLKESRINGAVYAKINSEKDFIQYGTEDKELYLENYKHYLNVVENNASVLSEVIDIKNNLLKKKHKYISKPLIEFLNLEILFRDGDTSLLSYFKRVIQNAKKEEIDLIEFPMVYKLLEIAFKKEQEDKFKTLDNKKMLDELAILNQKIKAKMAKTIKAQEFVELIGKLMTLEEFLRLRILETDFELYKAKDSEYRFDQLAVLIAKFFPKRDTAFLEQIDPILGDAEKFYEVAHARSEVLYRNSLENMKVENKNVSVTISGGYHTEAMVELCRANDISYLRIMPTVTSDEVTVDYEGRMLNLKSELLPNL